MPERPRSERVTQDRLAAHITTPEDKGGLGYRHLGDWSGRPGNRCVEPDFLRANLSARGYSDAEINAALMRLMQAIEVTGTTLYQANLRTYTRLRPESRFADVARDLAGAPRAAAACAALPRRVVPRN